MLRLLNVFGKSGNISLILRVCLIALYFPSLD